ncbi:YkvA family protein [Paenibacillus cellulositrophicus]|uniref:YkvA family protein n=1 Tax=Paenibacillus cellulositrophicus TaxID=562959 RepID=UPI0020408B28|nr:YkvA family protein [Paenibacillus cellulositrophicus]MCM2998282.1 YkvA family protein [Paenibacillus cellulositrophicus]
MMEQLKAWAKQLKRQVFVLYYAYRDKRSPWYAKLFSMCVVAYAFSPIDLIPDFIPVIGYADDLVLIPLGVLAAIKMMPGEVIEDAKKNADARMNQGKPVNWAAGVMIILLWAVILAAVLTYLYNRLM